MMLRWDHKYEVGHERIDFEHRIFLGLIVDFQEASECSAPKEKLQRILNEISKYAEFHFLSEENIMLECNYPEHAQHAKRHGLLLADLKQKLHLFRHDEISSSAIFDFLFHWFALHTSTEDKELAGFVGHVANVS